MKNRKFHKLLAKSHIAYEKKPFINKLEARQKVLGIKQEMLRVRNCENKGMSGCVFVMIKAKGISLAARRRACEGNF